MMSETLPNWGPARPMREAPDDGRSILVERKILGGRKPMSVFAVVHWRRGLCWYGRGSFAAQDSDLSGWWPLPEQTR